MSCLPRIKITDSSYSRWSPIRDWYRFTQSGSSPGRRGSRTVLLPQSPHCASISPAHEFGCMSRSPLTCSPPVGYSSVCKVVAVPSSGMCLSMLLALPEFLVAPCLTPSNHMSCSCVTLGSCFSPNISSYHFDNRPTNYYYFRFVATSSVEL